MILKRKNKVLEFLKAKTKRLKIFMGFQIQKRNLNYLNILGK